MRKASTQIIADLRASYSKRALLGLWADLRELRKEEFERVIEGAAKPKGAAKKKKGIAAAPLSPDRPASRIAQLMLEECGLSPSGAVDALRAQLATQGIRASHIPALTGTSFESWLSKLFKTVPSSHVLHAAVTLAEGRTA
jgi:hypothetical protein